MMQSVIDFWNQFSAVSWGEMAVMCKAFLEIIFIYILIYAVIMYVRGTRAAYILIGIFAPYFGLWVASYFFDFTVALWLMQQFWAILSLACVVIFQPELRRAFASLGAAHFQRGKYQQKEMLDEIVLTARFCSKHRIGALIVFERNVTIRSLSATGGVPLDCKVSAPLLECIFMHKSPLHDGAVVIRDDRIIAAHMILPLAHVASADRGTRHRAAIGVTEESDAIALVVSEERGDISVAHRGKLVHIPKDDDLVSVLYACLSDSPDWNADIEHDRNHANFFEEMG